MIAVLVINLEIPHKVKIRMKKVSEYIIYISPLKKKQKIYAQSIKFPNKENPKKTKINNIKMTLKKVLYAKLKIFILHLSLIHGHMIYKCLLSLSTENKINILCIIILICTLQYSRIGWGHVQVCDQGPRAKGRKIYKYHETRGLIFIS